MAERDEHASREMVTQVREEVKQREKAIMQRLMAEERELWLDEHLDDKGNGTCERSLLTSSGLIEDLRVPRTRSSEFYPAILPGGRRASVNLGDLILIIFQCGINTRRIQQVIEAIYGTSYYRIAILQDRLGFEDYFNVLITRPSRYADAEIDVSISFDSVPHTAERECVEALGLVQGDTVVVSATIYPPEDILTPIAMCSVYCSGEIADWLEVRLRDSSLDEREWDEEDYVRVRLRILFGEMVRIEHIDFPRHGKAYVRMPIDGLEIVHVYDESYQSDQDEEYYDSYDYDDEEDDDEDE